MSTALTQHLAFFSKHAPFDRMQQDHLLWMLERMQMGYYAQGEILLAPEQGNAPQFFVLQQGVVHGSRLSSQPDNAIIELLPGECFPIGALLAHRPVTAAYRAAEDVFCFELSPDHFLQLLDMSAVFKDFCTRRIAALFEQSTQAMQAQLAQASSEQQSLITPLSQLIRQHPVTCTPDTPIQDALQTMETGHLGSMIITDADNRPLGIFTLRDLLSRVTLSDIPLSAPIQKVMSQEPACLPPEAPAQDAALLMAQKGFRHVLVTEKDGSLRGIVSERDLFSMQRVGLRQLGNAIRQSEQTDTLILLSGEIRKLTHNMMAQGVAAEQLTQLISTLNDMLCRRVIELECLQPRNQEQLSCFNDICWLALGSEGRMEQTFYTDQDNGILFSVPQGESAEAMRQKLLPVARRINEALDGCGFSLCKGGIMASNPKWCLSLEEWQNTFADWIEQGSPEDLLNASIFFDFRSLYGNSSLAASLRNWLAGKISANPRFLHLMAANALRNQPPLGVVRDFVVNRQHTLDIKLNGTTPFVDAARILSLASGSEATGTVQRLRDIASPMHIPAAEIEGWIEAFHFLQSMRLLHQYECETVGLQMDNLVNPDHMNDLNRRILKETFRQARKMQSRLAMEYRL